MIDFNVAVKVDDEDSKISGATGLKEWSAPETRTSLQNDFNIDCWTLGCLMFLLCTGEQPFQRNEKVEINSSFNLLQKMMDYCESETYSDMVDFISKLLTTDPTKRLSAAEALGHSWLQVAPYTDNN